MMDNNSSSDTVECNVLLNELKRKLCWNRFVKLNIFQLLQAVTSQSSGKHATGNHPYINMQLER